MTGAIAAFELRRWLGSPLAWTVLAIVQFVHALLFYIFLSRYLQQPDVYQGHGLGEVVVAGYFQTSGLIMLLITPFLTMRLISTEAQSGTLRLLLSSPVSATGIVLGKFSGLYLFALIILALTALVPTSLVIGTTLDFGQLITAIIGLALLLAAFTAWGLFISSLFRQAVIAAVTTLVVLLTIWTAHLAGAADTTGHIAAWLSAMIHFNNFTEGMFSSVDFFYFVLVTALGLVLTIWRMDWMRIHA